MNTKEIDIIELIARLVRILKKWIILLIIFIVLGAGFGYYQFNKTKIFYKSNLKAESNFVSNLQIVDYIQALNSIIQKKNDETANKLGISLDYLKNIKQLSASSSDEIALSQYMFSKDQNIPRLNINEIIIEVYDTAGIKQITNGIINFIDNIDYVRNKMNSSKQTAKIIIDKIDYEINKYDSLQTVQLNELNSKEYTRGTHIGLIEALERKAYYENIINSGSITVMKDFSLGFQTKKSGLLISVVIGVLIGMIAWFILIFILEIWKRIVVYNKLNKKYY